VLGDVDLGVAAAIGGPGIVLNGVSNFQLNTFGGSLRINGAIRLRTDATLVTANGNVTFTAATPIDSDVDRTQSLTIDAGAGAVFFNEDIGATNAIRGLTISRALAGVTFGEADIETAAETGPVERIQSVDAILIGSAANPIIGGIRFNAGSQTLQMSTTGDDVVLHGTITLASAISIDTGTGPGDIFFGSGPIDSQPGEANDLTLRAGTGRIDFNANLGALQSIGTLTITQADGGVAFGTSDSVVPAAGRGPVAIVRASGAIDIGTGTTEIAGTGIHLNAGPASSMLFTSLTSYIRLNGAIHLEADVNIVSGGSVTFTNDTPIDSQAGEANDLTLDAPTGAISINEDIGRDFAIGSLVVFHARDGLMIGGATNEFPGTGGLGPVEVLRTDGPIDFGVGANVIGGAGIVLSGSAIAGQQITTTGDTMRFNGAVSLATDVEIATQGGEILYTNAASIDSAAGRTGSLRLNAGTAAIRFNEDIGATRRIGSLIVTQADGGVRFGEADVESTVAGTLGPVNLIQTDQPVDLGVGANVLSGGIAFRGGDLGTDLSTTNDQVRLNGPVHLENDLSISTGDGLGDIVFTSAATIDSSDGIGAARADQRSDLTLDAGDGGITFNANIGWIQPLDQLQVLRAAQTVAFGGADLSVAAGEGPVTAVRATGGIDLGVGSDADNVLGHVVLNGGPQNIAFSTSGNDIRINGKVTLHSQTGEQNPLEINVHQGDALFNASVGANSRLGSITLHELSNAQFESITAARVVQENGTGKTTFHSDINTNDPILIGLSLRGNEFEFDGAVLATGDGRVDIQHTGLLDLNSAADMRLDGAFSEHGSGSVELAASIATSADPISFNGPVRLTDGSAGNILLSTVAGGNANGANIRFLNSLDGQNAGTENLLLNAGLAGNIQFALSTGANTRLGTITIVEANQVDVGFLSATRFVQSAGQGTTTFHDQVNLNHATLAAINITTRNVRFEQFVRTTGNGSVSIFVSGLLELTDNLFLTGSFHAGGSGTVRAAGFISTTGPNVVFERPVILTGDLTIHATGAAGLVKFSQTVDGTQPFAQDLTIDVPLGDVEFIGTVGATVPLGWITIDRAEDVTVRAQTTAERFAQTVGTGLTTIAQDIRIPTAGSISIRNRFIDIQGNLVGPNSTILLNADQDLVVSGDITTDTTGIALRAGQDIFIRSTAAITTRSGIAVVADTDLVGGGEVRMEDGASLASQSSTIQVTATDDITLARLVSPLTIVLTSTAGGIIDSGDTGGVNIEAPALVTRTAAGVGNANILETKISTFAARNSGPGGIRITNDVAGTLTIGTLTVDNTDRVTGLIDTGTGKIEIINRGAMNIEGAIRNGGGGDTVLRAEFPGGNLTVNQPIQNTGGDGFIVLFAGGDLTIHDSLPEPRDANGNQIENPPNPEQFFEIYVVGEGGVRGEAVGKVLVDNGEQRFVIIHTDTAQITNVLPIISIETVDQGGSDIDQLGRAFVKVTLGDEVHLETNYQVTIDWGDGEIEHFPIPGTINPLRQQFKGNTDPRYISGAEGEKGVYTFLHKYFGNPNADPSAPINIRVEVRHDPRASGNTAIDANRPSTASGVFNGIRFFENVVEEIAASRTDFFTLPGIGGLGFVKVVQAVIVPVELRAPMVEPVTRSAPAFTASSRALNESTTTTFESGTQEEYRIFMRVVDDVLGTESEDIPLDLSVLDDPVAIFRRTRFPNGHYRVYLEEIKTRRTRVILDVYIYNGRVVPPDFRAGAAEKPVGAEEKPVNQPAPNQNGLLRPNDSAPVEFPPRRGNDKLAQGIALGRQNMEATSPVRAKQNNAGEGDPPR
jgi:hypothetical protein